MGQLLTKKQAVEYLGIDEKTFDNYFKNAAEFAPLERQGGGRYQFDEEVLSAWLKSRNWRTVELTAEDYALCLDFALAMHFRGYVVSDWGTARQREFGQKITNWVKGQLAEVGVKKFFKKEFGKDIELDFSIYDEIVAQDIIGISENGAKRKPKVGVGIKSSKPKSAFLVLGENEITRPERRSDYYILARPDIPDDHLLRITKDQIMKLVEDQQHYHLYKDKIPSFENMPCEICGWCSIDELRKTNSIPGQEFEGVRYVIESGKLHKSKEDWEVLLSKL